MPEDIMEDDKIKEPFNWKKELLTWAAILIAAYVAARLMNGFVIIKAHVDSGSMTPTVCKDDYIMCNKLTYMFNEPERLDIILFAFPDNESKTYVKRIIGLPGETIEIKEGKIYVDNVAEPLDEPYLKEPMLGSFGPYSVPEDSFFVLGDNRNNSYDSRGWDNSFVSRREIYGKAWFRYKPSWGKIN